MTAVVWRGLDEPRMEIAHVERGGGSLRASGTQIGITYELRYELQSEVLRLEVVGGASAEVALGELDFFDLGSSPLFNSLPVLRDGLLDGGDAREYVVRWVSVPELDVSEQAQRYVPLPDRVVRFESNHFVAEIRFGGDGLVDHYPGLAERVG